MQSIDRIRSDLLAVRCELAARRFRREILRAHWRRGMLLMERKYSPEQPRVPAGNSAGGQWTSGGSVDVAANTYGGTLAAEFMTGDGRRCVYSFDFGLVVIPGPVNFRCPPWTTSASTSHGRLLNDNRKMVHR